MIVTELDFEGIAGFEAKAYAPLIIDRDSVLTGTITLQSVQPIAWGDAKIGQLHGDMHGFQFSQGAPRHV